MPQLDEVVGGTTGVRITDNDFENAEKVGYETDPPSTVLTNSLEDSAKLQNLQEEKKDELIARIVKIKEECDKYDIEFSELI